MDASRALGHMLTAEAGKLAGAWAERVDELPRFSARPPDELRRSGVDLVNALARFFLRRDEPGLRGAIKEEAGRWFKAGIPLDDVVRAYHALLDLVWDECAQLGPEASGPIEKDLVGAIGLAVEVTVAQYQKGTSSEISLQHREVEQLKQRLQQTTIIDELTGLFTAAHFRDFLAAWEIRRSLRYQHPLSLLLVDIDDFQQFNATYGMLAGDQALKAVAQTVTGALREVDVTCRLDADDLAVILPDTPPRSAVLVAERVRLAVEERAQTSPEDFPAGPMTVSVGVAGVPDDAESVDDLLARARDACDQAKRLGKNVVSAYADGAR